MFNGKNKVYTHCFTKITVITVIFVLTGLLWACNSTTNSIDNNFNSVFELTCSCEGAFDSIGTGFKVEDKIITNAHVVFYTELNEKYVYDIIKAKIYNSENYINLEVYSIDYEKDIAILKIIDDNDEFNGLSSLELADSDNISIGDPIYTIGNLNGYGLACNDGIISANKKLIENEGVSSYYIQTNIEISKGSSGGPVFNSQGKVIGMMTFKVRDQNSEYVDGMSFFIPLSSIKDLL